MDTPSASASTPLFLEHGVHCVEADLKSRLLPSTTGPEAAAGIQRFTFPDVWVPFGLARYTSISLIWPIAIGEPDEVRTRSTAAMTGASNSAVLHG